MVNRRPDHTDAKTSDALHNDGEQQDGLGGQMAQSTALTTERTARERRNNSGGSNGREASRCGKCATTGPASSPTPKTTTTPGHILTTFLKPATNKILLQQPDNERLIKCRETKVIPTPDSLSETARTEDSGVNPETQHYTQPKGQRTTSNVNMPHTPIQRQDGKDGTVAHSTQVNFRTKLSGIKKTFQNGKSQ